MSNVSRPTKPPHQTPDLTLSCCTKFRNHISWKFGHCSAFTSHPIHSIIQTLASLVQMLKPTNWSSFCQWQHVQLLFTNHLTHGVTTLKLNGKPFSSSQILWPINQLEVETLFNLSLYIYNVLLTPPIYSKVTMQTIFKPELNIYIVH